MTVLKMQIIPAMLALIFFLVTLPFFDSVSRYYTQMTPPVIWHSARAVTEVVTLGNELEIVYNATINRQCPAELRSFIVAEDGSAPVRFPPRMGGYTPPSDGPVDIPVRITIPTDENSLVGKLVTGKYIYRTVGIRFCPEGIVQDMKIPDVPFRLVVPTQPG